jgi:hypothetical protein
MSKYIVKQGESIGDVVMNNTGSLSNWDEILKANEFDSWTPDLIAGQSVIIPDSLPVDANTKRQLALYPACNASVNDVYDRINDVFNIIYSNWILETGFWRDQGVWMDNKSWKD